MARTSHGAACTVQPRVCGERARDTLAGHWVGGSAPRVRGTVISVSDFADVKGSAPRVRGTDHRVEAHKDHRRFSPACAGNGAAAGRWFPLAPVQPRVCGERITPGGSGARSGGSAPRVRGTGRSRRDEHLHQRFSPACAGNGHSSVTMWITAPVQPRVCGERDRYNIDALRIAGSAPRVRGTAHAPPPGLALWRFSPACAGNGLYHCDFWGAPGVQPRVCGERFCAGRG